MPVVVLSLLLLALSGPLLSRLTVASPLQAEEATGRACEAGPPYTSRSDTRIEPKPPLPTIGGANSKLTDPIFHNKLVRVTDARTASDLGFPGRTFGSTASAEVNRWSADDTHVAVLMPQSNRSFVFTFQPDCGSPGYMDALPEKNFFRGRPQAPWGTLVFNAVEPNIAYGMNMRASRVEKFVHDHQNGGGTLSVLFDAPNNSNLPKILSRGGSFSATFDTDANIAVAFATDRTPPTGQGRWDLVVVCVNGLGCRYWDTLNREMGGDWGPSCSNCGLPEGVTIHNVQLAHRTSGEIDDLYVTVAAVPGRQGRAGPRRVGPARMDPQQRQRTERVPPKRRGVGGPVTWKVNSTTVEVCSRRCRGHRVAGQTITINNAADIDSRRWARRLLRDPNNVIDLLEPPSPRGFGFDMHPALIADESFVISSIYQTRGGSCDTIDRALICEIVAVATDGSGTVHRFAHHRAIANHFWSIPKGNVCPHGHFWLFTSNWENTLEGRREAFIVELK